MAQEVPLSREGQVERLNDVALSLHNWFERMGSVVEPINGQRDETAQTQLMTGLFATESGLFAVMRLVHDGDPTESQYQIWTYSKADSDGAWRQDRFEFVTFDPDDGGRLDYEANIVRTASDGQIQKQSLTQGEQRLYPDSVLASLCSSIQYDEKIDFGVDGEYDTQFIDRGQRRIALEELEEAIEFQRRISDVYSPRQPETDPQVAWAAQELRKIVSGLVPEEIGIDQELGLPYQLSKREQLSIETRRDRSSRTPTLNFRLTKRELIPDQCWLHTGVELDINSRHQVTVKQIYEVYSLELEKIIPHADRETLIWSDPFMSDFEKVKAVMALRHEQRGVRLPDTIENAPEVQLSIICEVAQAIKKIV